VCAAKTTFLECHQITLALEQCQLPGFGAAVLPVTKPRRRQSWVSIWLLRRHEGLQFPELAAPPPSAIPMPVIGRIRTDLILGE
jgi:hypothetical protein